MTRICGCAGCEARPHLRPPLARVHLHALRAALRVSNPVYTPTPYCGLSDHSRSRASAPMTVG